jgi:hypothetical protein
MPRKKPNIKKKRGRKKVRKNLTLTFYWKIYRILKDYYNAVGYEIEQRQLRIYAADIRKYIDVKVDAKERGRKLELKFFKEIVLGGEKFFKQRLDLFNQLQLPFPEEKIASEFFYWDLEQEAFKVPKNIYFIIDYGLTGQPDAIWEGKRLDIPYSEIIGEINDFVRYKGARADYYGFIVTEIEGDKRIILLTLEELFMPIIDIEPLVPEGEPKQEEEKQKPKEEKPEKEKQNEEEQQNLRKAKAEADDAELKKLYGSLDGKRQEQKNLLEIMIMKKKAKLDTTSEEKEIAEIEKQIQKIKSQIQRIES